MPFQPSRPAMLGNQHATKDPVVVLSAKIYVRLTRDERAAIMRAAAGSNLSAWCRKKLLKDIKPVE